jgi:hypothetical protein
MPNLRAVYIFLITFILIAASSTAKTLPAVSAQPVANTLPAVSAQKQKFCEPNFVSLPYLDNKTGTVQKETETGYSPDLTSNGGIFWLSLVDKNGTLLDRLIKNNPVVTASTVANLPGGTEKGNTGVFNGTEGNVTGQPNIIPTAKDIIIGGYTKDAIPAATGGKLQPKKVALVAGIRPGISGNGTGGIEQMLIVAMSSQSEKTTTARLMAIPLSKLAIHQNYTDINPLNFLQIVSKLLQKLIWVDCVQGGTLYLFPPDPRGNGLVWYKPTTAPVSPLTKITEIAGGQEVTAINDNIVQFAKNECGVYSDANLGFDLCLNPSCTPDVDGAYHTSNACFHEEEGMCDGFIYSRNGGCGGHYVPPIEFNCHDNKDDDQDGKIDASDQDCEGHPQTLPPPNKHIDNLCYYKAGGTQGQLSCYSLSDIDKNPCFFYPAGSGCSISKDAAKEACYDNPVTASNDFCRKQYPNALVSICGGDPSSTFSSYCSLLNTDAQVPPGSTNEGGDTGNNTGNTGSGEDCTVMGITDSNMLTRVNYIPIAACLNSWNFPQSSGPVMEVVADKVDEVENKVKEIILYCTHDIQECGHLLMQADELVRELSHNTGMTPREILEYIVIPILFTL